MALSKIRNDSLEDTAVHGNRNLIINGAMQIFQRATAATAATGYTTADRWHISETSDGAYTSERSTDNPFGTGYSIKLQCTTADTSLAATQFARVYQRIEAQNLQHLLYGTSSAKTLTLSFWVKSSKTGIYSILLRKEDNTAYHFIHSYTISSADTWEKKIITITPTAGSTSFITASAGAIANDNAMGFELAFNLAQGSSYAIGTSNTWSSNAATFASTNQVNWMDSTANNLYLTKVQLEVGEQATPFEHRSFGDELAACQRYYTEIQKASGQAVNASVIQLCGVFPTEMRTTPSASLDGALTIWQLTVAGSKGQSSSNIGVNSNINSASVFNAECANFSSLTQHQGVAVAGGDQPLNFDAEL